MSPMTSHSQPRDTSDVPALRRLLETDRRALVAFLQERPEENVFLLSRVALDGAVPQRTGGVVVGVIGRDPLALKSIDLHGRDLLAQRGAFPAASPIAPPSRRVVKSRNWTSRPTAEG